MTESTDSFLLELIKVVTALIAIIYIYFKWSYQYWSRRNVPSLEPTIPFGNMQNPTKVTMCFGTYYEKLYNMAKTKGFRFCGIYRFTKPILLVTDLELIKRIMAKDFEYFTDRGMYTTEKEPISCHIFAMDGSKWRNLRAKISPTFTSGKLKAMFHTLVECGNILVDHIEQKIDTNNIINVKDVSGHFTTDVIGSCAFGLDCSSFTKPNSPFREYGRKIFETNKLGALHLAFVLDHPNLARKLGIGFFGKEVNDFFTKVVEKTVTLREKNNIIRNDFLQLLIDMKNKEANGLQPLTMNELIAQCFLFFAAGFETSSSTMGFALYLLATHPHIQERARKEIEEVLDNHNGEITYESIFEMKYLRQVIDETLRVFPSAPCTPRKCAKDYKIPGEDVVIEKGTRLIIPIQGLHHNPEYFPNPEVFDPDRFSEENKKKILPYSYLPFGEGPRICIGERFGLMQVLVGMISILRKFKLTLNERTETPLKMCVGSLVLTSNGGIWVNLERV